MGRERCGTEMGMPDVHEPAWGLPGTELSTELHPCFVFLIIMSENKSFNQDRAAAQQENLNRNYQYFILCL